MKHSWQQPLDLLNRSRWLRVAILLMLIYAVEVHIAQAVENAGFTKLEDFNALSLGGLNGQGGWSASGSIQVAADPDPSNTANRVMQLSNGAVEAYKALPEPILDSRTGTIHFRMRRAGHIDGFAGTSDLNAPSDWPAFETQFGAQSNQPADAFVARNGTSFSVLNSGFSDQRWFCVWLVANNASNRYEVYVKGGSFTQPTKLSAAAQSSFAFRNGGSDPLRSFFTRLHQSSQGSLFLDDIYVDPSAQNLTLPDKDCATDTPPPPTGFVKVDDFNTLPLGALNGRNGWSASSSVQVVADPLNASNPVMQLHQGPVEASKILSNTILNSNTGTLHFRVRRDGHIDGFAGASDLALPSDWPAFETQFGAQSNRTANEFVARDGTAFAGLGNGFIDRTWFCVWLVANNLNNSYEIYLKGGDFGQPTKLNTGTQSLFAFRNGGNDPLRSFFTRLHQSSQGTLLLDDIYVDPAAQNLTTPLTSCGQSSNNPPDAVDDTFQITQGTVNNLLNVLANDSIAPDVDEVLSLVGVGIANQGGIATLDGGQINYSPRNDFTGSESFTYTISDGNGAMDSASVTVTVEPAGSLNLSIAYVEVSQAIQTNNNDVPLIANRPMIVRVSANVHGGRALVSGVNANLRAARNGVELSGSPLQAINGPIVAKAQPDREQLDDTLNFQLPQTWLDAGVLTLWAELNPTHTLTETTYSDNVSPRRTFDLLAVPPLEIVLIPIAYQKNGQGPIYRPNLNDPNQLSIGVLPKLLPVSQVRHQIHAEYYFGGDLKTFDGWGQLLGELSQLRQQERPNEPQSNNIAGVMPKYYGVIPLEGALWGGLAYVQGTTGMGLVGYDFITAHELGHNFGLLHVESSACAANPDLVDTAYPYSRSAIGHIGVDAFDLRVIPAHTFELMSYCGPQWISDYHYKKVLTVLRTPTAAVLRAAQQDETQADQPALLISGRIASNGQSASLNHALPVTITGSLLAPGDGSYEVVLIDREGNVRFTQPFEPAHIEVISNTVLPSDFGFAVPRIDNLALIQVRKEGVVLASLQASAKPQLTTSFSPDASDPKKLLITWQLGDASPATPTHINLRYSADGGQSWQLIALAQTQSLFRLDLSRIPGSSNAKIEVIASTATDAASVVLDIGQVSDKSPVAAILEKNPVEFAPNEVIVLLGTAVDFEDGSLSGESLKWFSEDNRLLGSGTTLILPGLAEGVHTIRLQATDKAGHTVTTSIQIIVQSALNNHLFLPVAAKE